MSFFKRLAGVFSRSETTPATPAAVPAAASPTAVVQPSPPRRAAVTWQEILDERMRIAGYLLRPVSLLEGVPVAGTDLLDAINGERLARLGERRLAVLPLTLRQWREADFRPLAGPGRYFLLKAESPDERAALPEAVAELLAGGVQVAVAHADAGADQALAGTAQMLVLRLHDLSLPALEQQVAQLRRRHPDLRLVVDEVGSWDEYRFLRSLGIAYCLGPFATQPDVTDQRDEVSQGRLVVIDMMNHLRGDADLSELAVVAKRDPAVVVKLLEMANSPVYGLARQVATIEEAIMLLGRETLYRWLALAMFRVDSTSAHDETLMVIALSRASFLEGMAPEGDRRMAGELFLVGLLSLIDSLLKMPMAKILERMNLPPQVAEVLLGSDGPYARYLMLVMAMERAHMQRVGTLCTLLELDVAEVVATYGEAVTWASATAA